ncbi:MAG: sulfur carrier protein ThiS [Gammaproteobacteria bacterium]|nr:sulfur carrier protein ThiS [Gammaproteobacteria bacterium]
MKILLNGEPRQLPEHYSVLDLLKELHLAEKRLAVERNGEIIPRSTYEETALREADKIEIVHAIGGG